MSRFDLYIVIWGGIIIHFYVIWYAIRMNINYAAKRIAEELRRQDRADEDAFVRRKKV